MAYNASHVFIYLDCPLLITFNNMYQLTIKNCVTNMKVKELEGGEDSKANMQRAWGENDGLSEGKPHFSRPAKKEKKCTYIRRLNSQYKA